LPKVPQHNSSSTSTHTNEIIAFKGWPNLIWFITEHLTKPSKDWLINELARSSYETTPAYIEYTSVKDGSIVGVTINYEQFFVHTQTLVNACKYSSSDITLCCVDFKRQIGLWHTIHANILSGMQIIYIPTAILKSQPSSWLLSITKYHITTAIVRSRDMHWAVLAVRDMNNLSSMINLSSLRLLLISDGSNPWSLTAVDTFLSTFISRGLRSDCCCPCSYSSETLTLSIRRQYHSSSSVHQSGRGILSMHSLSYGVVRVDQDNSLTSLTIQDVGHVLPGAIIGIVKIDGPPSLCQTDEIGEVVISSKATPNGYWALPGLSSNAFKVIPLGSDERPIGTQEFVRSGLLGFLGPVGFRFTLTKTFENDLVKKGIDRLFTMI
jgi:acyl-CoA synthetase (AMP-forming)/AMP-acid ligase II